MKPPKVKQAPTVIPLTSASDITDKPGVEGGTVGSINGNLDTASFEKPGSEGGTAGSVNPMNKPGSEGGTTG